MKHFFEFKQHEEYGSAGWLMRGRSDYDPLAGMAVAHDILEHFPTGSGTAEDELLAFGAMFHVRGADYFGAKRSRDTNPAKQFSGELVDLLAKVEYGQLPAVPIIRARPCEEWLRDDIAEGILEAQQEARDRDTKITDEEWRNVERWIIRGYYKALARYKDIPRMSLLDAFMQIEERADELLKDCEERQEGTLVISLTWRKGRDRRYAELDIRLDCSTCPYCGCKKHGWRALEPEAWCASCEKDNQ